MKEAKEEKQKERTLAQKWARVTKLKQNMADDKAELDSLLAELREVVAE